MQVKISFHNMPHSDPLEKHVQEKLAKLHELLKNSDQNPPFFVEVWLKANKQHPHHSAEMHVKTSRFSLHTHDEGTDLYIATDNTIDKMIALVRKEKEKMKTKQEDTQTEKTKFKDDKYTL